MKVGPDGRGLTLIVPSVALAVLVSPDLQDFFSQRASKGYILLLAGEVDIG